MEDLSAISLLIAALIARHANYQDVCDRSGQFLALRLKLVVMQNFLAVANGPLYIFALQQLLLPLQRLDGRNRGEDLHELGSH